MPTICDWKIDPFSTIDQIYGEYKKYKAVNTKTVASTASSLVTGMIYHVDYIMCTTHLICGYFLCCLLVVAAINVVVTGWYLY